MNGFPMNLIHVTNSNTGKIHLVQTSTGGVYRDVDLALPEIKSDPID